MRPPTHTNLSVAGLLAALLLCTLPATAHAQLTTLDGDLLDALMDSTRFEIQYDTTSYDSAAYSKLRYNFIRYDLNRLNFFSSDARTTFEKFYDLFDTVLANSPTNRRQVHILHLGGSHIQADVWTGHVRERLRGFAPQRQGARGFIFPQKLTRSNGSRSFRVEFTGKWYGCRSTEKHKTDLLGLSGVSATTIDSGSVLEIFLAVEKYPRYTFNRVKVFHQTDNASFVPQVANPALKYSQTINSVEGYTEFRFEQPLDYLALRFVQTATSQKSFVLYGLNLENDEAGFVYSAVGVNGAQTTSYLRCQLLEKQLAVIKPDLVVFSIGINDTRGKNFSAAAFEARYDDLIQRIKRVAPNAALLFTSNSDSFTGRRRRKKPNANVFAAREAMIRLSKKHRAAVWDLFSVMGGLGSMQKWYKAGIGKRDLIHFSRSGYFIIGDLMTEALLSSYQTHRERAQNTLSPKVQN